MILIQRISVITLHQHYFPTDSERSFGEDWGRKLGRGWGKGWGRTVEGMGRWGLRVIALRVIGLRVGQIKKSLEDFSSKLSKVKEGGDLLSRIALQYHRRRRA